MSNSAVASAGKSIVIDDQFTSPGLYGDYELARIRKSPDNRKRFNELALQELAASIKAMGVAQPILIRPVTPTEDAPEGFEIVAGERRYRASIIAGMTTIPAVVRILSDLDAAKLRILENLQREDPHPMEEAEGYQLLMLQHGFTADQLADEVKKSRAYIYGRLKLCALTPNVREQFLDEKISASIALLIARIPVPDLQIKAMKEILKPTSYPFDEPMSYRRAALYVQGHYMLDLSSAAFNLTDANLLPSASACTTCPKRAGNQPELFEGIGANVCTDPECFAEKRSAHQMATIAQAKAKGVPVYEGVDGEKLIQQSWGNGSKLVLAGQHITNFARNAPSTTNAGHVGKYLTGESLPPVAAYAQNSQGALLAMYEREAIQTALEAVGACETVKVHAERMRSLHQDDEAAQEPTESQPATQTPSAEVTARNETTLRVEIYKRLRQRAAANGFSLQSLRELTKLAVLDHPLPSDLLGDIYDFDSKSDETVCAYIDQASLSEVNLLLVDLLVGETLSIDYWAVLHQQYSEDSFTAVAAMAQYEGIDPEQVREELFPTPIDATDMQYDDLVKFIRAYPGRLAELTEIVLTHPRGELVGLLQTAADSLGYRYVDRAFHLQQAEEIIPEAPAAEVATPATDDAGDELAAWAAEEAQAATNASIKKAKPAAKASPAKVAAKPDEPAPEKKPAKPSKSATKAAAAPKLADPWPFPKSSRK